MILPDVNLLVYAHDETARHHASARAWWYEQLNGARMVGLAWVVVLGFIRLVTNRQICQSPYAPSEALEIVGTWLSQPHVRIIHPSEDHFRLVSKLIAEIGAAGNLTTDAHLAALAIERGLVLHTTDADFARFKSLKWRNPVQ
ncbi:MAG: type II toxin-antitoxin system VapC family toxin [Verrucomicrobiales bacterium]|nr:type II toxin-antitoxin system VapC family toxin [Verrucomicrobiales bacterium]